MFEFPSVFWNWLESRLSESQRLIICDLWETLVRNYLNSKPTPTMYYFEMFNDDTLLNFIIKRLIANNIIESKVNYNFAELNLLNYQNLTEHQIKEERIRYKFKYYMLKDKQATIFDVVKLANKYQKSGIIRKGFMKAGSNRFQYDTKYIIKYAKYIAKNIYDDPDTTIKDVKYEEIIELLIKYYGGFNDNYYTVGDCVADSRGRAIYEATRKIFNPISHKDARACIKIKPIALNSNGLRAVFAFIAELNGYKGKNIADKISHGKKFYKEGKLPSLNDMISKDSFKKLHERIWLERIYENLMYPEKWTVAIECDATASVLQVMSVLLNDYEYMDLTNLVNPSEFKDAWTIEGLPRDHVKKAMTPRLYASMQKPAALWEKHKYEYTQEQVNIIEHEIYKGRFKHANDFKNFIINNVHPQATMTVKIWDDTFIIKCNRYCLDKPITIKHKIYLSKGYYNLVVQRVYETPDLESFKRYFVTLLIHNLDSQVANYIALNMDGFIIPNHDAFLVHPNDVSTVRHLYTKKLYELYKNRRTILINYFKSIGIEEEIKFTDTNEVRKFSGYCLK